MARTTASDTASVLTATVFVSPCSATGRLREHGPTLRFPSAFLRPSIFRPRSPTAEARRRERRQRECESHRGYHFTCLICPNIRSWKIMAELPADIQEPTLCPGCGFAMIPGKLTLGQTAAGWGFCGTSMPHLFFTAEEPKPAVKESVFSWIEKHPRKGWHCTTCGMVTFCGIKASEPPPEPPLPPRDNWWEKYH